jgi:hypothetical protein
VTLRRNSPLSKKPQVNEVSRSCHDPELATRGMLLLLRKVACDGTDGPLHKPDDHQLFMMSMDIYTSHNTPAGGTSSMMMKKLISLRYGAVTA